MRPPDRTRGGYRLALMAVVLATVGVLAAAGSQLEDSPGGAGGAAAPEPAGPTLTLALSSAPSSLDPARAEGATAANLVWNLFDPLVRLGPDLAPVPGAAQSWEASRDARRFTFRLRGGTRWSNGSAVTARDYVYAWKRVLDPATQSPFAERLFAIAGAAAYHRCAGDCAGLRDAVAVRAPDARTLVVDLTGPRAWFPVETAHVAFLPVHTSTVERLGREWTDAESIVTNGPFTLESADESGVVLVKNREYHGRRSVALGRVRGRVMEDPRARVQAFDAGEVMALDGGPLPAPDLPALRERREYQAYPTLGSYLFAFNLLGIRDVHQRRAMALALDRTAIVANAVGSDVLPATRFTPAAAPGFEHAGESPWLPPEGDRAKALEELAAAASVKEQVTLLHVDAPGNAEIALAVRDAWRAIGIDTVIRARDAEDYLAFEGSLSRDSVDLYQLDLRYPYPDAFAGLTLWRCGSNRNKTNFCRTRLDELLAEARREEDASARRILEARAEDVLSGEDGALPAVPVFWHTSANLEALSVGDTFAVNALGQIELARVRVE